MSLVDSNGMLRNICSTVYSELFPYDSERKPDGKQVDDQLFELQKLALNLQHIVLDIRQQGANADALRQRLYEVIR